MRIWASDYSIRYSYHCSDFSIITCIPVSLSVTWHLTVARSTHFLGRLETFSTHSLQQNLTAHLDLLSNPCGMPSQRPSPLLEEYDCASFSVSALLLFILLPTTHYHPLSIHQWVSSPLLVTTLSHRHAPLLSTRSFSISSFCFHLFICSLFSCGFLKLLSLLTSCESHSSNT